MEGIHTINSSVVQTKKVKVGVIGEGKMGSGIFYFMLEKGFNLVWICSDAADPDKLRRQVERKIMRLTGNEAGTHDQNTSHPEVIVAKELHAVADCDIIIEAIPENLELKRSLFRKMDGIVKPEAIFATNSSSIKPSLISPSTQRSERFAGLHFFYPVALKNIVEINLDSKTSEETIEILTDFLNQIQRRFILLDDANAFFLNKLFLEVQNEAWLLVESGYCTISQMDQLVKKYLFPAGIFVFFDSVGIDTILASVRNYTSAYPNKERFLSLTNKLENFTGYGKLGMKSGEGFYQYKIEESAEDFPEKGEELARHLRQIWLSAAKRYTVSAHLTLDDANFAIREYFDLEKGPFE